MRSLNAISGSAALNAQDFQLPSSINTYILYITYIVWVRETERKWRVAELFVTKKSARGHEKRMH